MATVFAALEQVTRAELPLRAKVFGHAICIVIALCLLQLVSVCVVAKGGLKVALVFVGLAEGEVEVMRRKGQEKQTVALADAVTVVADAINAER